MAPFCFGADSLKLQNCSDYKHAAIPSEKCPLSFSFPRKPTMLTYSE